MTPLGPEALLLTRFSGAETMSDLFDFQVTAGSTDDDIDFDALLGQHCTVSFDTITGEARHFDGICVAGGNVGVGEGTFVYSLTLRPWLWTLSKRVNNKIFKDKDVLGIVSEVFGDHPSAAFRQETTKTYPTLEYTVQTQETDLNFVSRLMQRFGVSYYFEHSEGTHTMVLCDGQAGYGTLPGKTRDYHPFDQQNRREDEHFESWASMREFTSGRVVTLDYNFEKPTQDMKGDETGDAGFENGEIEVFDYPNKHSQKGEGTDLARTRVDQLRAADKQHSASGNVVSLAPGMTFELEKHPIGRMNKEYLCVGADHSFVAESFYSGAGSDGTEAYSGSYRFAEAERPLAPPRSAPAPSVRGVQTATVVGDGEIDVDKYGRILVRFHWDREGRNSMRCRIAQSWAGAKWGGVFFPRVGMEVVVEFAEGDADNPIVVGCLYNADNMPPFDLPGSKNINGFKSNSTEGGGGYNELVFDDTKGNELFRQHAQYDMDTTVLHDERRNVKNDQTEKVDANRTQTVVKNDTLTVNGSRNQKIGFPEKGGAPGSTGLEVAKDYTLKANNNVEIEALAKITLKCGASKITMTPASITIESPKITTDAAGMADHKAGGVMNIKAALVKIN